MWIPLDKVRNFDSWKLPGPGWEKGNRTALDYVHILQRDRTSIIKSRASCLVCRLGVTQTSVFQFELELWTSIHFQGVCRVVAAGPVSLVSTWPLFPSLLACLALLISPWLGSRPYDIHTHFFLMSPILSITFHSSSDYCTLALIMCLSKSKIKSLLI